MKILTLKFKNINSLFGEWAIDFADSQFTDNGLFAITGKTGAGKSSILDAISLALYGKTPRVDITGNSNDVMTRGTSDCYAELVFEIEGKKWKSSWKQERTRSGNLKSVQRQIADGTDQILTSSTRDCDTKIEEIVGLTFEQFTKVIMLAQGSFAAFLQAEKNEKGELLEQITGTEIYGEISKKVFERNKTENQKLENIITELGAIEILSEEEMENLHKEIGEIHIQKKQIDDDLQMIETAKKWLADLENIEKQITDSKLKLPDLEITVETAKNTFQQSETLLKETKSEKEKSDKVLVKIRELDTKIAEKDKLINPVLQTIGELNKHADSLTQIFDNQNKKLTETRNFLKQKEEWATTNSNYELLVEQFAVIEIQHVEVNNLLHDLNRKNDVLCLTKKDWETQTAISKNAQTLFEEREKTLLSKELELKTKKEELLAILSGKELNTYQVEKENLTQFGTQIKNLIEVENGVSEKQKEIEKLQEFITASENSEKEILKNISDSKLAAENLKSQIEIIEENIKLVKTIQSLDEHRKSLSDGAPCPLCGSLEHPFALGNEPKIGEKETALKNLKEQEQHHIHLIQQNEKTGTKLDSDKNNALTNKEKAEKNRLENVIKRDAILNEIKTHKPDFSVPAGENKIERLEEIHKQKQNEYKQIATIISKVTESEKWINKLRDEVLPEFLKAKQSAEKAKTEAETNLKLVVQKLENETKSFEETEKLFNEKNSELLKVFSAYSVTNIENLKKCLDDWNSNKRLIAEQKDEINKLETALALTNSDMENNQKQTVAKTAEKESFEAEKQALATVRYGMFGDKQVEEEEKKVKEYLEKAEIAKAEAEKSVINANTELEKNRAVVTNKEKELAEKKLENITEKSSEELQSEYAEKKPQCDRYSQKIGAIEQELSTNNENIEKNRKKLDEKQHQQQICNRWGRLNELIGSQDGKKYRNFAQALTFEHLIGLTNRQLQKISERYILKRVGDVANPFELAVIDKYHNGEERTAKNLSGGEKFIISLSLALGLANMASKNMQIDTMFIDEGFGTLDADFLDVTLSALSNLQNEGKLIGIISHLTELKERIPTHIEVIAKGDGRSIIEIIFMNRLQ
jgi:exonuclease SbcC